MGFFRSSDINEYLLSTYNRLLNSIYLLVVILMIPIIYFDYKKAITTHTFLIILSDSLIALVILLLYLYRKKLGFHFRSFFISAILLIHSCVLLATLGLPSEGMLLLIFIIAFNAVIYGKRVGWISMFFAIAIILVFAVLLKLGYFHYDEKIIDYSNDPNIWVNRGISFTIYAMVLFFFIIQTRKVLDTSLQQYSLKNNELQKVNLELETLVKKKQRVIYIATIERRKISYFSFYAARWCCGSRQGYNKIR